jgi:hypothetical protein
MDCQDKNEVIANLHSRLVELDSESFISFQLDDLKNNPDILASFVQIFISKIVGRLVNGDMYALQADEVVQSMYWMTRLGQFDSSLASYSLIVWNDIIKVVKKHYRCISYETIFMMISVMNFYGMMLVDRVYAIYEEVMAHSNSTNNHDYSIESLDHLFQSFMSQSSSLIFIFQRLCAYLAYFVDVADEKQVAKSNIMWHISIYQMRILLHRDGSS